MRVRPGSLPLLTSALALRYDGIHAPRVTAKGHGEVADQILQIAREHGIPLHEDSDLLNLLGQLDLGDEIPRALYIAVAEVIAFAYLVSGKVPDNYKSSS
ncbi:flagellar biosynthesis protein [Gammaproteobacteria bacterium]